MTREDRFERVALAPIGRWIRAEWGRMTKLVAEVNRLTGRRYHRQKFEQYFRRVNPISPRAGMLLVIQKAWENLKDAG